MELRHLDAHYNSEGSRISTSEYSMASMRSWRTRGRNETRNMTPTSILVGRRAYHGTNRRSPAKLETLRHEINASDARNTATKPGTMMLHAEEGATIETRPRPRPGLIIVVDQDGRTP